MPRLPAVLIVALLAAAGPVHAQDSSGTGLPVPRFVSLAADEVNMRAGPGIRYPVEWVYLRRALPVEVTAEFGVWRRVRDIDGTIGWVHTSMLSSRRSVIVVGDEAPLHAGPSATAGVMARVEGGAQGQLLRCQGSWCQVRFDDHRGWIASDRLWGVYREEAAD